MRYRMLSKCGILRFHAHVFEIGSRSHLSQYLYHEGNIVYETRGLCSHMFWWQCSKVSDIHFRVFSTLKYKTLSVPENAHLVQLYRGVTYILYFRVESVCFGSQLFVGVAVYSRYTSIATVGLWVCMQPDGWWIRTWNTSWKSSDMFLCGWYRINHIVLNKNMETPPIRVFAQLSRPTTVFAH